MEKAVANSAGRGGCLLKGMLLRPKLMNKNRCSVLPLPPLREIGDVLRPSGRSCSNYP